MKYCLFAGIVFAGFLTVFGDLSEKELKRLRKEVDIAGTSDRTIRNDDRKRIETLEVNTFQGRDNTTGFRMYLAVQLMDREKNSYFVEFTGEPAGDYDSEYQGEDFWTLRMPYGDLTGLKIKGYVIQYGVMDDGTFIPLAQEYDGVKTLDELKERPATPFPGTVQLWHYYMYDDPGGGVMESIPRAVKEIK